MNKEGRLYSTTLPNMKALCKAAFEMLDFAKVDIWITIELENKAKQKMERVMPFRLGSIIQ